MREHIGWFRGKRIFNDEWVEGYFLQDREFYGKIDERSYIVNHKQPSGCFGSDIYFEVYPDTVGECTGLRDKNGKLIFEGDVLRIAQVGNGMGDYYFPPVEYPVKVVVRWDMCAWMWETLCEDKRFIGFPTAWCHYECEIIGNVHDNPELLKGGEGE